MRASPADVLRSLVFYTVFYGSTVPYVFVAFAAMPFGTRPYRAVVESWSRWHRWCVRRLLCIRVVCEGEVPRFEAIVAIKHESFFEAIDLPNVVEYPAVFAKVELTRIPLWGRAAVAYGIVAVERDRGARTLRAMLSQAKALLAAQRMLVIFPEGTRVPHGTRRRLQAGFAGLYKTLGLPVIPVAVDSGPLYHRRWKRKGTITYRVGDPVEAGLPRAEMEERVLQAINALNPDQARDTLTD